MFEVPLRDYQTKVILRLYELLRAGRRRILIQMPPGSGKTITAARAVADALPKDRRVLFLAHRRELITQPRDTFAKFGMTGGIVKAGFDFEPEHPLQIASVQTLINRLAQIHAPDIIIVDEAHHATAGTWDRILAAFPDAIVIGLSGTPERADGTGLDDTFEEMIDGPSIPWLIESGFLVDCDVYGAADRIQIPRPKNGAEYDYKKVLRALERKGRDGDPLVQWRKHHRPGRRGVGFGPSIEYCNDQADRFRAAGYRAFSLTSETDDEERDAILAGFENGTTDFVWNCGVIGEGTDIPDLEILIDCMKTKSLVAYLQRVFRILRPAKGKEVGIYIDLVGNAAEHGHPCIARQFSLQGEKGRKKLSETTEDGEHLSTRQCNGCFQHFRTPAQVCPYCDFDNGIDRRVSRERAAEIRKLKKDELAAAKKAATAARLQEERDCNSLDELIALGHRRGYNPNWAYTRWKKSGKGKKAMAAAARDAVQMKFGADGWPT